MRVKICGITNLDDARYCKRARADLLGFIFCQSKRQISAAKAKKIIKALRGSVDCAGVFVDAPIDYVIQTAKECGLKYIQLHGSETNNDIKKLKSKRWKVIKAVRIKNPKKIINEIKKYSAADAILLDSYKKGVRGGTGTLLPYQKFNIDLSPKRIILAGGLSAASVGKILKKHKPWGVDVSSGVELRPGKKSRRKVKAFINAAKKEKNHVKT